VKLCCAAVAVDDHLPVDVGETHLLFERDSLGEKDDRVISANGHQFQASRADSFSKLG
jgi:hypothetical protein